MMPLEPAHLDAIARQAGFPDYATWVAWNQHRTDAITQGSHTTVQNGAPAQPNFLMSLINKIPIHPSTMLNYIADRYRDATGQ